MLKPKSPAVKPTKTAKPVKKVAEAKPKVKLGRPPGKTAADGVQITLRLSKAQLALITRIAKTQGLARASYIKQAVLLKIAADQKVG